MISNDTFIFIILCLVHSSSEKLLLVEDWNKYKDQQLDHVHSARHSDIIRSKWIEYIISLSAGLTKSNGKRLREIV